MTLPNGQNADDSKPVDDPKPTMVPVTVDGVEHQVTQEELVKSYELAKASKKRMADAADIRKQAEDATNTTAVLREFMQNPTQGGFEQLARSCGLDDATIREASEYIEQAVAGQTPGAPAGDAGGDAGDLRTGMEDLTPELQAAFAEIKELKLERRAGDSRDLFNKMLVEAGQRVDKDEIFGKMVSEGKTDAVAKVKRYVEREVERKVGLRGEKWPDVLEDIIREARSIFENVSNPGEPNPVNQADNAIGPAAAITSTVRNQEPPKPLDIRDPGYTKNVGQRVLHTLARLAGQAKK